MILTFDGKENKHNVYKDRDCMKKFSESLRERAMKIINFQKKKMIPLTNAEQELYEKWKSATFTKKVQIKAIVKLKTIVIIQVNAEVLHIAYEIKI